MDNIVSSSFRFFKFHDVFLKLFRFNIFCESVKIPLKISKLIYMEMQYNVDCIRLAFCTAPKTSMCFMYLNEPLICVIKQMHFTINQ